MNSTPPHFALSEWDELTPANGAPDEPPPGVRAWVDMDAEQARRELRRLRKWIETVLVHEARTAQLLRPCWYRHPAAVQTLLDVSAAWRRAYRDAETEVLALEWTQRHLSHLEERLARELHQCRGARHDPEPVALPRTDDTEVDAYIDWWTGNRPDARTSNRADAEPPPLWTGNRPDDEPPPLR